MQGTEVVVDRVRSVAREGVKALLPEPTVEQIQRRLYLRAAERQQPARPIDLDRLDLIREAQRGQLREARWIENDLLPRLGLNDEEPALYPTHLHPYMGGLLCWQYPNQFSKYLVELARLNVRSYLEIGVRHGGTFAITVEYLEQVGGVDKAVGVDLVKAPSLAEYAARRPAHVGRKGRRPQVKVSHADSHSPAFAEYVAREGPFDLALIDGDHSEEGCRADFELVSPHARMIAFHDIVTTDVPGVPAVWNEVKELYDADFEFLEFTDQYPEVTERSGTTQLGIGLAVRRG